jgi:putative transposase
MKVSRAGFYSWCGRPECTHAVEDRQLTVLVRAAHERSRRSYGSPRVHAELKSEGISIARKRVARLMHESELAARPRKRFRAMTMDESEQQIAPTPGGFHREDARWRPLKRE